MSKKCSITLYAIHTSSRLSVSPQVETYVEEEDEDTVKHSTAELAKRASFIVMADQMKAQGEDVRASLVAGEQVLAHLPC